MVGRIKHLRQAKLTSRGKLKPPESGTHTFYVLVSMEPGEHYRKRTYPGESVDEHKRLRQHNGEISGGAKFTRKGRPYAHALRVKGLRRQDGKKFEHAVMSAPSPPEGALSKSGEPLLPDIYATMWVLQRKRWSTTVPPAATLPPVRVLWDVPDLQPADHRALFGAGPPPWVTHVAKFPTTE